MKYLLFSLAILSAHAFGQDIRQTAAFKEGSGISMGPESKQSVGIEVVDVVERSALADIRITAQVYRESREVSQNQGEPSGFAYASAWIEPEVAETLKPGSQLRIQENRDTTGTIIRVDQTMAPSGGRVEVLIQVHDGKQPWRIGDFVKASLLAEEGSPVAMIPVAALLETAFGPFVYVVNGSYYSRTAVETGSRFGDFIEITDGLYGGDQVVAQHVEALYLIELRATKGGGHSH